MNIPETAELIVPIAIRNVPIVTGMVEQSATIFGLDKEGAQNLGLAAEEVFNVLASAARPDEKIRIVVRQGGYYVEVACYFSRHAIPITALNITKIPDPDDESDIENLGIILAAKVVDRLQLVRSRQGEMALRFTIERRYPEQAIPSGIPPAGHYSVGEGGFEEIKQFASRVSGMYGANSPGFFRFPGKIVDMVKSREFGVLLALDGKGNVGGGMLWKWGGKMIDSFGPYIFTPQPGLVGEIVQGVLEKVGRKGAVCIVNRMPADDLLRNFFEELVESCPANRIRTTACHPPLYRQLEEDTGSVAYVHPEVEIFVKECYERLVLPRSVVATTHAGEFIEPHAAFGVQVDKKQNLAVISTIVAGIDAEEVLAGYVASLYEEGITRLEFEIDLGDETTPVLVPALHAVGFIPCYVLPWGGRGDILVFEHQGPRGF